MKLIQYIIVPIHFRTLHKYTKKKKQYKIKQNKKIQENKKNIHQWEEHEECPKNYQILVMEDQNIQS